MPFCLLLFIYKWWVGSGCGWRPWLPLPSPYCYWWAFPFSQSLIIHTFICTEPQHIHMFTDHLALGGGWWPWYAPTQHFWLLCAFSYVCRYVPMLSYWFISPLSIYTCIYMANICICFLWVPWPWVADAPRDHAALYYPLDAFFNLLLVINGWWAIRFCTHIYIYIYI